MDRLEVDLLGARAEAEAEAAVEEAVDEAVHEAQGTQNLGTHTSLAFVPNKFIHSFASS